MCTSLINYNSIFKFLQLYIMYTFCIKQKYIHVILIYLTHLVTFSNFTYFLSCGRVNCWKCLATDRVHKPVVDKNLQ